MARRSNKNTTEATAEVTTEAPEEATVSTTTEETPEATATESESTTETAVDLSAFREAVNAALSERDESTGDVPLASVEPVTNAYRALDGVKAKNQAKKLVNDAMVESMNSMDIATARAYLQISEQLTAGSKAGAAERVPSDPTEAAVQRIATLQLARDFVVVPENVADDFQERAERFVSENADAVRDYISYLQSDNQDAVEPDVSVVVKNAAKLALGKQAKAGGRSGGGGVPFTGERRDIGKHIAEAFAGQPVDSFLTVAEIRKFRSEEYGDNPPSAGAISARLFPQNDPSKSTMRKIGLESGQNEKGNKGARKVTDGQPLD